MRLFKLNIRHCVLTSTRSAVLYKK
uniref:Uncharacterized protein n=1 Tax=Anguilla anguilla TaxID=7936 RepID=A0A0E9RQV8_ANGAN